MNPTKEQSDIVAQHCTTSNNIMIDSFAGTGKSTTLDNGAMFTWDSSRYVTFTSTDPLVLRSC